jgi:general secretion pathway protein L
VSERLNERWERSAMPGFFTWWWRELAGCLPASLKRQFKAGEPRLKLRWPLPNDVPVGPARVVSLLLEPAQVLECHVQLPRMPRHALGKVMVHEIDRYTPFSHDEVYFDVRVLGAVPPGTQDVRLTVIARSRLDDIVCQAQGLGIEVASVDVLDSHGQPQGIELLSASASVQQAKRASAIRQGLLASSLILTLACMSAWVERREQALEVLRAQLVDIRASALQVDAMHKQLQARIELERTLRLREAQRLGSVALLDLLTRCLPEQAWLDGLRVDADGQLVLTGTSSRASELPAQMGECAGLLKPTLLGGIQPEPETGREHFTLQARLPGGEE